MKQQKEFQVKYTSTSPRGVEVSGKLNILSLTEKQALELAKVYTKHLNNPTLRIITNKSNNDNTNN